MLAFVAIIIIIAALVFTGVMVWQRRASIKPLILLNGAAIVAAFAIANLPRVESVAVKIGENQSLNVQMQKIEQTAQQVGEKAQQVQTNVDEMRRLKETIAEIAHRVEESEHQLSQTNAVATKAKKELTDLQEQRKPRRLSPEQKQVLVEALSSFSGQKVSIQYAAMVADAGPLADDFVDALSRAKWDFEGHRAADAVVDGVDHVGIEVVVSREDVKNQRGPQSAEALAHQLDELGIKMKGIPISGFQAGKIMLMVGRKP